ncbi:MAG: LysR family transcriptional regulator [Steroidobacteraceae bacterium]
MEIRQLKHFLAVLEHGSMSRAAEALGISHQGLSKSIAGLEESLQVQLLVRGPRGVTASAFGQVLQEYARFIDGEHDNALHALAALRGGGAGHLTIATGISAATTIVPTAAGRLFARRPGTSLTVLTGPYAQFRAAVEEGEIALFIGTVLEEAASPVITIERLFVDRDYVVARPGHPLMQRASVSLAELSTFPWVFSVGTHEFRRDFLRRFEAQGRPAALDDRDRLARRRQGGPAQLGLPLADAAPRVRCRGAGGAARAGAVRHLGLGALGLARLPPPGRALQAVRLAARGTAARRRRAGRRRGLSPSGAATG